VLDGEFPKYGVPYGMDVSIVESIIPVEYGTAAVQQNTGNGCRADVYPCYEVFMYSRGALFHVRLAARPSTSMNTSK